MNGNPASESAFDKDASLALKGIAILLMLFHHNFRDSSLFSSYDVSFFPFSEAQVVSCAYACKICVSFFAFITGYGLYRSYRSRRLSAGKWTLHRYIKTFSGYWFVWVLSAVICQTADGRTAALLFGNGRAAGLVNSVIDFLGLADLFRSPTLNGTWWYMSAAAVFILLIPLLYVLRDNLWLALAGVIVLIRVIHNGEYYPGGNSAYAFLTPFILGFLFAHCLVFERCLAKHDEGLRKKVCRAAAELCIIALLFKMYGKIPVKQFWEFHFGLFPAAVIFFCAEFVIPLKAVRAALMFFGKHSMNIFLTHTFIRAYYFSDFTYSWKHFALITLVLLAVSVCISLLIELLKKLLRYDLLISRLLDSPFFSRE